MIESTNDTPVVIDTTGSDLGLPEHLTSGAVDVRWSMTRDTEGKPVVDVVFTWHLEQSQKYDQPFILRINIDYATLAAASNKQTFLQRELMNAFLGTWQSAVAHGVIPA